MLKLFYFGQRFTLRPRAQRHDQLRPLHHVQDRAPSGWYDAVNALEAGEDVHIRPANEVEIAWAEEKMKDHQS